MPRFTHQLLSSASTNCLNTTKRLKIVIKVKALKHILKLLVREIKCHNTLKCLIPSLYCANWNNRIVLSHLTFLVFPIVSFFFFFPLDFIKFRVTSTCWRYHFTSVSSLYSANLDVIFADGTFLEMDENIIWQEKNMNQRTLKK